MDWLSLKDPGKYVLVGLVLGMVPPLIALHLLHDYQAPAIARHHSRTARDANTERSSSESIYIKMFDKPKPRHPPSSNSRNSPNKHVRNAAKNTQSKLESLSSVRALGFMKKMFVAILSEESRVKEMEAAVGMTWGSDVIDYKFMSAVVQEDTESPYVSGTHHQQTVPIPVKEKYGKDHYLESLQYACNSVEEDYRWYMVTKDSVYIDTEKTLRFLDTLYHADSFVLGQDNEGTCTTDQAIVLSKRAFDNLCQNIESCSRDSEETIGECLALVTDTTCTDLAKASGTVYTMADKMKNKATIKLNSKSLVYTNIDTPQAMYQLHLQKVNQKISETTKKISLLRNTFDGKHTTKSQMQPSVFLKEWEGKLDRHQLNATRPSHRMIDQNGALVRSNCQRKDTKESMTYATAKQYADDIVGMSELNLKTYGYRRDVTAFQMIHEFYYTAPKLGRHSVSYVTVSQNYSVMKMISSDVYQPGNYSIYTTLSSQDDVQLLQRYLENLHRACSNLSSFKVNCEVFLMVNESDPNTINITDVWTSVKRFIHNTEKADLLSGETIKVIPIGVNDSLDTLVATVSPATIVAHTSVNSVFDHEYLLRCHINSHPLNAVYFPVPFQFHKADTQLGKEIIAGNGRWLSSDYRNFCILQETMEALSLNFFDLQAGPSHLDDIVKLNRYPDPGLSLVP